jgi:hypothetical protein
VKCTLQNLFLLPSRAFIAKTEESSGNTHNLLNTKSNGGGGGGGKWVESVIENIAFISGKTENLRL